ncbi:MAG TPA: DinB family protein [Ktedonobacteraceae bacterium]|nr:DinB family protein [Ktedonobacteraceae bacterium]
MSEILTPTLEQINAFEAIPSLIISALTDLSEAQMHHVPGPGEWSIHEVVIHLGDSETFGFERLRKTIAEEKPALQVYDEDAWARNLSYQRQERHLSLALFSAQRRSTAALLRMLSPEIWKRTAMHPERGEINLYDIFTIYLEHGEIHLAQIEQLKQSLQRV